MKDECDSIKQFKQLDKIINKLYDICSKSKNFFEKRLKIVIPTDLK